MKNLASTLILCLIVISCKDDSAPAAFTDLYGQWYLTESYMDPGDGSGTWKKAPQTSLNTISFERDGTFLAGDESGFGLFLNTFSSFKNQPPNLIFYTSNRTDSAVVGYTLSTKLELTPRCIEGCGMRYSRLAAF